MRAAGFLVPGAIGVQEGGFIALCAIYAIPGPTALALSLVKRLPEIVLGIPGLGIWHWLEARQAATPVDDDDQQAPKRDNATSSS